MLTRGCCERVEWAGMTRTDERDVDVARRTQALIAVERVTKTFGAGSGAIKALDDVSLDIATGEFFTLLGPSGCGKTTLLRLLAGFEHPDAGTVLLDGRSMLGDPPNRRPVNIVFQSYALFPHMSVAANVGFGLENQGVRGAALATRVAAALRLVRLESMAHVDRPNSPAVSNSASPLPARWHRSHGCCSSMSRCLPLIPSCGAACRSS